MNRQLSIKEVDELFQSTVRVDTKPVMSRREKLFYWAKLVRYHNGYLHIFHNLERWTKEQLNTAYHPQSAFAIAAADPKFIAAGLRSDRVGDAMRFFELTQQQLHEFSCDCSGEIDPRQMAVRIEQLA